MMRALAASLLCLFCGNLTIRPARAQARDRRVDELVLETAQLRRTLADHETRIASQEKRIAELERTVKLLQSIALPAGIPPKTPPWHLAPNWNQIRKGMSRREVVEILGPPTSEDTVIDVQNLYYRPDPQSTTTLSGTVSLTDDRVTAVAPPSF
jgi:SmpA/OmlA family protein